MGNTVIKPCPHCGGIACINANYSYKVRKYFVFVKCDICGAQAKIYTCDNHPSEEDWDNVACRDALNAWNMRI